MDSNIFTSKQKIGNLGRASLERASPLDTPGDYDLSDGNCSKRGCDDHCSVEHYVSVGISGSILTYITRG